MASAATGSDFSDVACTTTERPTSNPSNNSDWPFQTFPQFSMTEFLLYNLHPTIHIPLEYRVMRGEREKSFRTSPPLTYPRQLAMSSDHPSSVAFLVLSDPNNPFTPPTALTLSFRLLTFTNSLFSASFAIDPISFSFRPRLYTSSTPHSMRSSGLNREINI